jgi:hypothetical protein
MSATNSNQAETTEPAVPSHPEPPIAPPGPTWFQRLTSVLFIIFCFELGLFLLIYPWTDAWSINYFATAVPGSIVSTWHAFWNDRYVRGCISGIGVVNLWIAVAEVFRLFTRRHEERKRQSAMKP